MAWWRRTAIGDRRREPREPVTTPEDEALKAHMRSNANEIEDQLRHLIVELEAIVQSRGTHNWRPH